MLCSGAVAKVGEVFSREVTVLLQSDSADQ